ncbi:MAG: SDR family oxidoreductase [Vicinamibacterales bacterium]|mgnify:CR=1 FL=1
MSEKQRIALVTGASRGIGRAIADELAGQGHAVLRPSRQELDLRDPVSIHAYCSKLTDDVDILVNNAGINPLLHISDLKAETIHEVLQVNLVSAMLLTSRLAPPMADRGWGRIVSVSSIWSVRGREKRAMYAASKAGLDAFTRVAAVEFGPRGVLTNAVAPGFIDTELTRANLSPDELAAVGRAIPVGALGSVESIARVVGFLASAANGYVNGHVMVADGGFTCW